MSVRAAVLTSLFVAALAATPTRVQAQEPEPDPPTTEAPTTVPEPTTTLVEPPVTTPVDPAIPDETTTSTTSAADPAAGGDAPSETVPPETYTIPPRQPDPGAAGSGGIYGGQGSYATYPGRLVRVDARTARARAAETQAALDAAIAHRDALIARQAQLHTDLGDLAVEEREAVTALEAAQVLLENRAADAYIRGTFGDVDMLLTADSASDFYHRRELLHAVLNADEAALEGFQAARAAVDGALAETASELARVSGEITAAEQSVVAATMDKEFASRELAVFMAGGTVVIHGFAFPIAGPVNFGDSFGAPRMTGTEYEHWHEGTDIFAAAGTELVACERGVITRMGSNVLGGITLWLRGESGVSYYYAHLTGFAPGVSVGMVVEAGTVVGYVGNTGNAITTPPHLHFEVHPNGGEAINPYPLLSVAVEQPQMEPIRLG